MKMRTITLQAVAFALIPSVVLAASPAPAPDPLDKTIQSYQEHIKKDLSKAYNHYEAVTQPRPELPSLARPDETLERLVEYEYLGALPHAWIKTLNAKGESAQAQGQADGTEKPSPDDFKGWEATYAAVEPTGNAIKPPEEWAGAITAEPDSFKPAFEDLAKLQKKGPALDLEAYAKVAKPIEAQMQSKVHAAVAKALKALKAALNAPLQKVMASAYPATPWKSLKSPSLDAAANRYLAERYYKGRWTAGKSGPKNTNSTEDTAASKQKAQLTGTGNGDKNTEGSTGDGVAKGAPGEGGTGNGSASPGAAPSGTGTGNGKGSGSGTGPGF